MCKQSQTFSVRKNKAIKSLGGVVLAVAAIVAIGGSASADEVTATNATSSNAPTTAVTTETDTTSNATTAPATTNANTPATPTTTQEAPKEIPAKVESVTQAEAVKTVDNAQATLKADATEGDVDLTFSDIKSSGATSNYVAIYGAPNGGIAWSVFGLVNGANTGGGVGEGASGAGSAGNIVLTNIYSYKLALATSEGVKVVTFNDLDNDQTLSDLSGFDGTAVETGANVTTGSGTYGAGAGDVTQAAGSKLDSNSIRWVYGDSKARKASFTHATSGNNTSIVGGIFGEDSNIPVEPTKPVLTLEKVTVGKPKVAVTVHYYEVKETPKPEAPAKPATPTETPKTPVTYTPSETPKAPVTYQAPALPQTGEVETGLAVTAGIATLFSAVALAGVKRKA